MKLDHKKLAAKYWDMLHPTVNFHSLKEKQIYDQYNAMEKFLKILEDMESPIKTHTGGFYDGTGELVTAGDRVIYLIDGRKATLIDALQDGDADVKFDDGKFGMVKWHNLKKI